MLQNVRRNGVINWHVSVRGAERRKSKKEEKFFPQPFTHEYENNIKKTKTENQLQEHEQSIRRLEVIEENLKHL